MFSWYTVYLLIFYNVRYPGESKLLLIKSWNICYLRAKFHYAVWFEAGSKLVTDLQRAEIWPII